MGVIVSPHGSQKTVLDTIKCSMNLHYYCEVACLKCHNKQAQESGSMYGVLHPKIVHALRHHSSVNCAQKCCLCGTGTVAPQALGSLITPLYKAAQRKESMLPMGNVGTVVSCFPPDYWQVSSETLALLDDFGHTYLFKWLADGAMTRVSRAEILSLSGTETA